MEAILVTGSAGFIGSCFVRQLLATGSPPLVVSLDKLTYAGNRATLKSMIDHPRHTFVEGDIRDRQWVAWILAKHRPETIVNFAAESHVDRSIDGPAESVMTNTVGTFELLEVVHDYWLHLGEPKKSGFRFLQVSTDEVYGSLGARGKFTESTPYQPNSPYAASKAAADHFVRAYHQTYGLPTLTTNCSNNYGPYQFPEKLIPLMVLGALEAKPLPVYGDGSQVRDWLFVEDHCRAISAVLAGGRPGEVFNIGGNAERTNLQVVNQICGALDRLCPDLPHRPVAQLIQHVKDRPGHDRRYAIDAGKIQLWLGWKPTVHFETGLEQTVRWYLDNLDWVEQVTQGKYQRQRLGLEMNIPIEP